MLQTVMNNVPVQRNKSQLIVSSYKSYFVLAVSLFCRYTGNFDVECSCLQIKVKGDHAGCKQELTLKNLAWI
jgi:hypothetical protein